MEINKIYNMDCFEGMNRIPAGSVDLILVDPPYGTMDRKSKRPTKDGKENRLDDITWDVALPVEEIFEHSLRILRQNGKLILFSQEPYTSKLILNTIPRIQFIQRLAWLKNTAGNFLGAKQNAMQYIEDICVFRKDYEDHAGEHPLREYFLEERKKSGLTFKELNKIIGAKSVAKHYFTMGFQFRIPTEEKYKKLQSTGYFKMPYKEIFEVDREYKDRYPSVFNLQENEKSKSNVLKYSKDNDGYHPTQKPILLLEDLIKTYSNEGDTVLDFTMGSGSTAVACINTNRNYIGFELDKNYYDIAIKRISELN